MCWKRLFFFVTLRLSSQFSGGQITKKVFDNRPAWKGAHNFLDLTSSYKSFFGRACSYSIYQKVQKRDDQFETCRETCNFCVFMVESGGFHYFLKDVSNIVSECHWSQISDKGNSLNFETLEEPDFLNELDYIGLLNATQLFELHAGLWLNTERSDFKELQRCDRETVEYNTEERVACYFRCGTAENLGKDSERVDPTCNIRNLVLKLYYDKSLDFILKGAFQSVSDCSTETCIYYHSYEKILWNLYKFRVAELLLTDKNGNNKETNYALLTEKDQFTSCSKSTSLAEDVTDANCKNYCNLFKKINSELMPSLYGYTVCNFTGESSQEPKSVVPDSVLKMYHQNVQLAGWKRLNKEMEDNCQKISKKKVKLSPSCEASVPRFDATISSSYCKAVCHTLESESRCDEECFARLNKDLFDCNFKVVKSDGINSNQQASSANSLLRGNTGVSFDPKLVATLKEITKELEKPLIKKLDDALAEQKARGKSPNWCDKSKAAKNNTANISDEQCSAACNVLADFTHQPSPTSYQAKFPQCRFGNAFRVGIVWALIVSSVLRLTLLS